MYMEVLVYIAFYPVTKHYNISFIFGITEHYNIPLQKKMLFPLTEI